MELPVAEHVHMLGAQFLASAMRPSHPSHSIVTADPGPWRMKETLATRYRDVVAPLLSDGVMQDAAYKPAIDKIHSDTVLSVKAALGDNPVLGRPPPPISTTERSLPRAHRCVLAQLRSGHCSHLETYRSRIGRSSTSLCPECRFARQTTAHLFVCPATPTALTVEDLWRRPVEAMDFLLSLSSFSSLLPPGPLPPPPPPLPPPPPEPPPPPPPLSPPSSPPLPDRSFSSLSSVSSCSSLRNLYSPGPSSSSSSPSTSPKRVYTMSFDA